MLCSKYGLSIPIDDKRQINKTRTDYTVIIQCDNLLEEQFHNYAKYYYKAANTIAILLADAKKNSLLQRDTYFFPLAFMYRHR